MRRVFDLKLQRERERGALINGTQNVFSSGLFCFFVFTFSNSNGTRKSHGGIGGTIGNIGALDRY